MKGHGEKLSRKQEALISALLTAPTLADAAHTAGIGEVTAWRWLKDATFQATYREARRQVVQQAIVQVQQATGKRSRRYGRSCRPPMPRPAPK